MSDRGVCGNTVYVKVRKAKDLWISMRWSKELSSAMMCILNTAHCILFWNKQCYAWSDGMMVARDYGWNYDQQKRVALICNRLISYICMWHWRLTELIKLKVYNATPVIYCIFMQYLCQNQVPVSLHSDGCLRNDARNTTQTTAGLSLDWKLTLGKQSAGPAVGHYDAENTQTKRQETQKWSAAAAVVGDAPLCRRKQTVGKS